MNIEIENTGSQAEDVGAGQPADIVDASQPVRAVDTGRQARAIDAHADQHAPGQASLLPEQTPASETTVATETAMAAEAAEADESASANGGNAVIEDAAPRRPRFRDRPPTWWFSIGAQATPASTRSARAVPVAMQDVLDTPTTPRVARAVPATARGVQAVADAPANGATTLDGAVTGTPALPRSRARHPRRGLLALVAGLILLAFGINQLLQNGANNAQTLAPYAPVAGPAVTVTTVLGAAAGLNAPRQAVALPSGDVAVADTGNGRVIVLDAAGHPLPTTSSAPHGQPYALAVAGQDFYVLDAARSAIERFDATGRYAGDLVTDPALTDAKGMSAGPGGALYVANPRTNSVVVVGPDGKIARQFTSALGAGTDQFNQPSDVAVGADGTIYVLDSINNRIKEMDANGSFLAQRPVPPSDTLHSVRLLPLRDGCLLASDPSGALLVYPPGNAPVVRRPLTVPGASTGALQPQGISLNGARTTLLVADASGNRILSLPLASVLQGVTGCTGAA